MKIQLLQGDFGFCFEVALIHDNGKRVRHEEEIDPPPTDARRKTTRMVEDDTILIQSDWDYPGLASTFGWDMRTVQRQRCDVCLNHVSWEENDEHDLPLKGWCMDCRKTFDQCHHDGTDGTVPCKDCGLTQTDFITAAGDWLRDNIGAIAEDPGYFGG